MLITSAANIQEGLVVAEAMKGIRNLERSRIPIVGPIFFLQYLGNLAKAQRLQRTADRIAGFVEPSAKPLQIGADILRAFNQGISASQVAMLVGTTAQLPQLVKDVVNSNDPDASVPPAETALFVVKFVADVGTYLKTYHQSGSLSFDDEEFNEVLRFAHAAQATRDDWTKNRRFLPNVLGWVASGMSGALQGMVSSSPTSPPGFSDITGDMMGGLLEWKGGTELVATEGIVGDETGRIRWQSADSIEIKLPLGVLYTDLIGGWDDIVRGRFGLGAGAAAAGGPNYMKSWEGQRLTLRSYAREGRTYGGLNGETGDTAYMERESFEHAARDRDGALLLAPMAVLVFNAKLHYSPRTDIGTITKSWAMPRFTEIKDHPPMVANESDNWLAENGFKGANPLKWGKNTDKGPAFTLVVQKGGDKVRTGEVAGFGNSAADGKAGLRDNFQGREIKALSTSQVYFRRPQDRWARRDNAVADPSTVGKYNVGFAGGYIEHRSLFSPYWHVHNVEPSLWARAIAMGGAAVGGSADEDNGN